MNRALRDHDESAPVDGRVGDGVPFDAEAVTTCPPIESAEADRARDRDRSWDISDWFAIS